MAVYHEGPIDPFFPERGPVRPGSAPARVPHTQVATAAAVEPVAPRPAPARRGSPTRPSAGRMLLKSFYPLILVVAAGGAYLAYRTFFDTGTVWVLNGFDRPVEVVLTDEQGEEHAAFVEARGRTSLDATGNLLLRAVAPDGTTLDVTNLDVSGRSDLVVFNVLGAAAVQLEEIIYTAGPAFGVQPTVQTFFGESAVVRDGVEYIFEEPPQSAEIPQGRSQVSHWYFGYVGDGSWLVTVNILLTPGPNGQPDPTSRARAEAIVQAMRRLDPSNVAAQSFERVLLGQPSHPGAPPRPGQIVGPGGVGTRPPPGRSK